MKRQSVQKRAFMSLMVLMLLSLLVGACSTEEPTIETPKETIKAQEEPTIETPKETIKAQEEPTQAKAEAKTLVMLTPILGTSMDVYFHPIPQTTEIQANLYWPWTSYPTKDVGGGVQIEDTSGGEAGMQPEFLESWEVTADGKIWTLHIRPGVLDSYGNEFKADDWVWCFKRMLDSGTSGFVLRGLNITDIDSQVEVVDDYTLKVTLPGPNALVLRLFNVNNSFLIGPEARKHATTEDPFAYEWLELNPAATGPYTLEAWESGVQQVFVPNPYWSGPAPEIDRVIYREVPESANRVALLITGDAHIARDLTMDELDRIEQVEGLRAQCYAGNYFVYAAPNFQSEGPISDVNVRRALAYAVPYDDIINSVYRGRAKRLYGYATELYSDYLDSANYPYETDFEKARNLLTDAGYEDGLTLTMLIQSEFPEHERIAILLQDSFANIGVTLDIIKKPGAAFKDLAYSRAGGDLVIGQNFSIVLDPLYHALVWFSQAPPPNINWGGFTNEEFAEILLTAVGLPEGSERSQLLKRLQEIVIEEVGWISFANAPTCYGWSEQVTGYTWHTHNQLVWSELDIVEQ